MGYKICIEQKNRILTDKHLSTVAPLPDEEYEPSETDFEHYYDDVVGVSHDQLPCLLTKPLHKTQKVESEGGHEDGTGGVRKRA